MIVVNPIWGIGVGLEYLEDEDFGFIVILDLGILRITWYKDLIEE